MARQKNTRMAMLMTFKTKLAQNQITYAMNILGIIANIDV
jgi:hypothetical protein